MKMNTTDEHYMGGANKMVGSLPAQWDGSCMPEVMFPSGVRVLAGPSEYSLITGVVDWEAGDRAGVLPGNRWTRPGHMRRDYYPCVPVRIFPMGVKWFHPRWLAILGDRKERPCR